jgi:hypothetical protein
MAHGIIREFLVKLVALNGDTSTSVDPTQIKNLSSTALLKVGMQVRSNETTPPFPTGTTIVSIDDATTVTVSNSATATRTGDSFTFAFNKTSKSSKKDSTNLVFDFEGMADYQEIIPEITNEFEYDNILIDPSFDKEVLLRFDGRPESEITLLVNKTTVVDFIFKKVEMKHNGIYPTVGTLQIWANRGGL